MQHDPIISAGTAAMRIVHNGFEIVVAVAVGPRVLGFRRDSGAQLFASLPGLTLEPEGAPTFSFYGGHRLWVAPEIPGMTYAADDAAVSLESDAESGTVAIVAPADSAGWEKSITLMITDHDVVVDHHLRNGGGSKHEVAPWAITQLAVGGTAILPLGRRDADEFQADRSLVAWPYTHWYDPLLSIAEHHIEITATRSDPLKVGTALQRGWMAYRLGDQLFVKRTVHPVSAPLVDLGASGQCYCNDVFLELETLGALSRIPPGGTVHHREVWEIHTVDAATPLARIVDELDLDAQSAHLQDPFPLEEM